MNLLSWILFGTIMGIIVYSLEDNLSQKNLSWYILLGILGSSFGGLVAQSIFGIGITGFNIVSFTIAMWGAILIMVIKKSLVTFK